MSYRTASRRKSSPQDVVAHPRDAVPVLHRTLTQTNANNSKRFSFFPLFFTIFVRRMVSNFHPPSFPSALVFGLIITDPLSKSHAHAQSLLPYCCCCCLLTLLNPLCIILPQITFSVTNCFTFLPSSIIHILCFFLRGALVSLLAHFDSTPTLDGMMTYRYTLAVQGRALV